MKETDPELTKTPLIDCKVMESSVSAMAHRATFTLPWDTKALPSPEFTTESGRLAWEKTRKTFGDPKGRFIVVTAPVPKAIIALCRRLAQGGVVDFIDSDSELYKLAMPDIAHLEKTNLHLYQNTLSKCHNAIGVIYALQCANLFTQSELHKPELVSTGLWHGTQAEQVTPEQMGERAMSHCLDVSVMGATCSYCGFRRREIYLPLDWFTVPTEEQDFDEFNPWPINTPLRITLRPELFRWLRSPAHYGVSRPAWDHMIAMQKHQVSMMNEQQRKIQTLEGANASLRQQSVNKNKSAEFERAKKRELEYQLKKATEELAKAQKSANQTAAAPERYTPEEREEALIALKALTERFAKVFTAFTNFCKSEAFQSHYSEVTKKQVTELVTQKAKDAK